MIIRTLADWLDRCVEMAHTSTGCCQSGRMREACLAQALHHARLVKGYKARLQRRTLHLQRLRLVGLRPQ
jgi:hypothetical protein